jgi:hypothetical protein
VSWHSSQQGNPSALNEWQRRVIFPAFSTIQFNMHIFAHLRDRYAKYRDSLRPNNESWKSVLSHASATTVLAVLAGVSGLRLDRAHTDAPCYPSACHWFARSGALVVVCGTFLAFRAGAALIRSPHGIPRINVKPSYVYGSIAFALLACGTVLWGFGDTRLLEVIWNALARRSQ